jgi:ATP-dependent DNA helicase RecG
MPPKTDRQILALIANDPKISAVEMSVQIGVDRSTVLRHIDKLKSLGRITREGPAKGGHWKLQQ